MAYAQQIEATKRVIARKGVAVDWLKREIGETSGTGTPWRPKPSTGEPVAHRVSIVFFPLSDRQYRTLAARGVEISSGGHMGYMAAVDFEVSQKDAVLVNGEVMPIRDINVIAPDTVPILYEIAFSASLPLYRPAEADSGLIVEYGGDVVTTMLNGELVTWRYG